MKNCHEISSENRRYFTFFNHKTNYRYNLIKEKDIRMENILFGKEFFFNHMDIRSDIIFA